MSSGLITRTGMVLCAVLATSSFAAANEALTDGGWAGRSAALVEVTAEAASFGEDAPVLTTASLPPRRPKTLAQVNAQRAKPAYAQQVATPIRIAQTAPVKQSPLFWMTVGTGF